MPYKDPAAQRAARRKYEAKRSAESKARHAAQKREWYADNRARELDKRIARSAATELLANAIPVITPTVIGKKEHRRVAAADLPRLGSILQTDAGRIHRYFMLADQGYRLIYMRYEDMTSGEADQVFYYEGGVLRARNIAEQIVWLNERATLDGRSQVPYTVLRDKVFFHRPQCLTKADLLALAERMGD